MFGLRAVFLVLAFPFLAFISGERAFAQSRADDVDRAFAQATQLHEAGDIEGAIRGYQAILSKYSYRTDVRSNLGAAYARLGRYEDAIGEYKRALVSDSRNQTIRFNLALAYYKAAWFAEAATELSAFVAALPETRPERLQATLLLADCQVRLGEYKKVIALLTPLEAAHGANRTLAYLLGSALISDKQVEKGQALIDRVFRDEDSAEAHLLIGSILLLADDGHAAIKEFERALELNPKLPTLHAWYGRTLMRLGDAEKAIEVFKIELADNPNDFDANLFLGTLLRREKRFEEATVHLSRALRLRPRDSYARYHMGALQTTLGKPNEARVLLEEVVKEHPDFAEARVLLASVYYRLNRKADGDRERAIVQKLNSEEQAKQPGAQIGNNPAASEKGGALTPRKNEKERP
ncbi:MAG: tetratricopeptide repeat protein [Blastocatellia bacterium]